MVKLSTLIRLISLSFLKLVFNVAARRVKMPYGAHIIFLSDSAVLALAILEFPGNWAELDT